MRENVVKAYGEKIKEIRIANNLSQEQLGELTNVSRKAISNLELRGCCRTKFEKMLAAMGILNITDFYISNDKDIPDIIVQNAEKIIFNAITEVDYNCIPLEKVKKLLSNIDVDSIDLIIELFVEGQKIEKYELSNIIDGIEKTKYYIMMAPIHKLKYLDKYKDVFLMPNTYKTEFLEYISYKYFGKRDSFVSS